MSNNFFTLGWVAIVTVPLKRVGENLDFFCSGEAPVILYKNLSNALHRVPDFQWLHAQSRELEIPNGQVASELSQVDYDRRVGRALLYYEAVRGWCTCKPVI